MLFRFLPRIAASLLVLSMLALVPDAHAQNAADGYAPQVDNHIYAVVVQADGKALIGGDFTEVNGQPCPLVCRLLADGTIDPSFHAPALDGLIETIAVQADGRILLGGVSGISVGFVVRLNTDGSFDSGFHAAAIQGTFVSIVNSLAVQADGKVLMAGIFEQVGGQARHYLARLNVDGSLDVTFTDPDFNDRVFSLLVQADGKIVVAGSFDQVGATTRRKLARINPDGSFDATFVDSGADFTISAMAMQSDGKLLVGGSFNSIGGLQRHCIARLDANGVLDVSFIDPGMDFCSVDSIAVLPDGKTMVGGLLTFAGTSASQGLVRLGVNGGVDSAFSPDVNNYVSVIARQPDGNAILVGGFTAINGQPRNQIARLSADGTLDADFGDVSANEYVFGLLPLPDGKVMVGGSFTSIGGQARGGVARLFPNGLVDLGFAFLKMQGGEVFSVNQRSDGKLLVGGSFTQVREELLSGNAYTYDLHGLALLDPVDGSPDTSFDPQINGTVYAVDTLTLGKAMIGGDFTSVGSTSRGKVARIQADGSLDTLFHDPVVHGTVMSLVSLPDGKVLIGGQITAVGSIPRGGVPYHGVARLKPDGSPDSGAHGFTDPMVMGGSGPYDSVMALAVLPDDSIVIGGAFTSVGGQPRKGLAILNSDGSLSSRSIDLQLDGTVTSLAVQADGKILVSGDFTTIGGHAYHGMARLNATGSVDTTFVDPGADGAVYALALQADGKLLAGGGFSQISGLPRNRVARLSQPEAALQSLEVQGSTVTWHRGGTAPEFSGQPLLMIAWNNFLFAYGSMTRIADGWKYDLSQPLPPGKYWNLSVNGRAAGGAHNASHGNVSSVRYLWSGDDSIFVNGFEP